MARIAPVYRLTLFQPKSQDPTETAVLVPAVGAPHADPFRVATHRLPGDTAGLWKPYLAMPRGGRRSRVDPITKVADVGSMTADLTDVKLAGTSELERWLSAFIGDDRGVDQLKGIRGQWEESLDGGFTFQPYWAGRTGRIEGQGRLGVRIPMTDEVDRFKVPLFIGAPHASIADAWQAPLLPYGRFTLVDGIGAKGLLQAPQDVTYLSMTATGEHGGYPQWFTPSYVASTSARWCMTEALAELADDERLLGIAGFFYYDRNQVQLEVSSGGVVLGRYWVRAITTQRYNELQRVSRIAVEELDADDAHYVAYPAVSTVYGGAVVAAAADGLSEAAPLFLGSPFPINVVTLIAAVLDGKFGRLAADGAPLDAIRRRTASFTALAASIDATFRARITGETTVADWLPKHLLEPYDLALVPDAEGYLDLVSLARPAAILSTSAVTDAEIVASPDSEHWQHSERDVVNAVEVKTDLWTIADLEAVLEAGRENRGLVDAPPGLLDITAFPPTQLLLADRGEASRAFDFGLKRHVTHLPGMAPRQALAHGRVHARDLFARFGAGAHYVTYRRRRTADDGTRIDPECVIGSRRSLETSGVPEPSTHARGLNRIGLCIERQPDPGWIDLTFLDEGINVQAAVPDLGDLVLADGTLVGTIVDPSHTAILDTPAMNGDEDPVRVDIAITADGAGQPAADSPLWETYTSPGYSPDGLVMLIIRNQPSGQRLWVRGRSEPVLAGARLPSAWVFPTPESVLLTALTAPSALVISNIAATSADLAWTVGEAELPVAVLVDGALVATLPAGSASYRLTDLGDGAGLTPNTNYDVAIAHVDSAGGYTATVTDDFTTLASGAALPRPAGLQVLRPSAITLALFAADPAIPLVLRRAPDNAGEPDIGAIEIIANGIPGATDRLTDPQPVGPAVWWYALAHGSGAAIGPYTEWVSAVAESGDTPAPVYVRPTVVATPSETSSLGTLALTIEDPQVRVTTVEFRTRQGTAAWGAWTPDTVEPHEATVPIAAGDTSQIGWRVLGYDETGTILTLASGTETFGAPAVPDTALQQATDAFTFLRCGPGQGVELVGLLDGSLRAEYSLFGTDWASFGDAGTPALTPDTASDPPLPSTTGWADIAAEALAAVDVYLRVAEYDAGGTLIGVAWSSGQTRRVVSGFRQVRLTSVVQRAGTASVDPVVLSCDMEFAAFAEAVDPPPDEPIDPGAVSSCVGTDTYPVTEALLGWYIGDCNLKTFLGAYYGIDQLNDLSGNGRHIDGSDSSGNWVTTEGGVSYPGTLNGRHVASFFDAYLNVPAAMFAGLTAAEFFVVVKGLGGDPNIASNQWFSWLLGATGKPTWAENSGGVGIIREHFASTTLHNVGNPAAPLTNWNLYHVRSGAGLFEVRINKTLVYSSGTNAVGFHTTPRIGNRGDNSRLAVAELSFHGTLLGATKYDAISDEMLGRWGLA